MIKTVSFQDAVQTITIIHNMSETEALTNLSDMFKINGIDASLNMVIEMREKYLEEKRFLPYKTTDGRYRGYVYWEEKGERKRKPLTAVDIDKLKQKVLEFYKSRDPCYDPRPMTFERMFPFFMREREEEGVCEGTMSHDQYDWNRFMSYDKLAKIPIRDIQYPDFVKWFKQKLRQGWPDKRNGGFKPFTTKQAKNMRSLLTTLFQYAVDHGYAEENLSSKMGKFFYKKYCTDKYKPDSDQVYQDDEPTKIMELAFKKYHETNNFAYLAVILNFLLDLRVGELVVLRYSDLLDKPGTIHIQRQELPDIRYSKKKGRRERCGFIEAEHTKTWHDRFIVLSDVATDIIKMIKSEQERLGIESDYLFINKRGDRMHENSVNKVLREVLNPGIGTSQKSCHNIRKTVTSRLREELGVAIAARVAGHRNESTTDNHYSFSTNSLEKYSEDYVKVIDSKVPECLKNKGFLTTVPSGSNVV